MRERGVACWVALGARGSLAWRRLLLEVFESQDCCNQAAVSCVICMCRFVASRQNVLANSILVLNSVQRRQKVELARERPGMSPLCSCALAKPRPAPGEQLSHGRGFGAVVSPPGWAAGIPAGQSK